MFGHGDGNYELLEKRLMLGYQNYILPETLGQWSMVQGNMGRVIWMSNQMKWTRTMGAKNLNWISHRNDP